MARGDAADGIIYDRPEIGETVQIRAPGGGWCTPTLYVDGIRVFCDTHATGATSAATLSALPLPEEQTDPPTSGETVPVHLEGETAEPLGLSPVWDGTYQMVREGNLLARHGTLGHLVAVPLTDVEALQVRPPRDPRHAVVRGLMVGAAFAAGV